MCLNLWEFNLKKDPREREKWIYVKKVYCNFTYIRET